MSKIFVYYRYPTAPSGVKTVVDDWIHATKVNANNSLWIYPEDPEEDPKGFHKSTAAIVVEFGDRIHSFYPSITVSRYNKRGVVYARRRYLKTGDTMVVIPRDLMLWVSDYLLPQSNQDLYYSGPCVDASHRDLGKTESFIRKDSR